jgi:hypothetical protein
MEATQSVAPRPGVTAPDGDISSIPRYPCGGASLVRLGAVCNAPGAVLSCRIIFYDLMGAYVATSGTVTFTADPAPLDGSLYLATPDPDAWFPIGGPSVFGVHVDSISGGSWTITPMAL